LQLIAYGLVINQFGQVLLTERAETGAPALPGDAVAPGELPPEAAARAVRAATGLIVLAVRLVELRYEAIEPNGRLALIFRCIQRGGEIAVAGGKPQAGFFAAQALPDALPEPQRAQIRRGFLHAGGPPHWETQSPALGARLAQGLRRLWPGADAPADAPAGADAPVAGGEAAWQAQAAVLVRDAVGAVLWLPTPDGWRLPGGLAEAHGTTLGNGRAGRPRPNQPHAQANQPQQRRPRARAAAGRLLLHRPGARRPAARRRPLLHTWRRTGWLPAPAPRYGRRRDAARRRNGF
jgi:ADP-ribose pyrophosphatase YjhB (NUDIX family)